LTVLVDNNYIRNLLTIRYDPRIQVSGLVDWKDFIPKFSDPSGEKTEKLLIRILKRLLHNKEGPFIISLSSGIDSSLCLALLRHCFEDAEILGICAFFDKDNNELEQARKIAKKFDAKFKTVRILSIFQNLPELLAITKTPRWNTYHHYVAKEARKFGRIFLTGDGADEIFGGYVFRYNKFLTMNKSSHNWKTKVRNYLDCHNRDWVPDQKDLFGSSIKFSWDDIYMYFKKYFSNPLNSLQQIMLADYNGKLCYDFIPTAKKISEHYGLELIQIFLQQEIRKHSLHLPLSQKYDKKNNKGKLVLRKITNRFGVSHVDEKKGFSPDILLDWNQYGRRIVEKFLLDKESIIYKKKWINPTWVIKGLEKCNDDGDIRYINRMISILSLELWYRIFVLKEINPKKRL
jgi:asparagine synthase (glutamine-hydrolysing)